VLVESRSLLASECPWISALLTHLIACEQAAQDDADYKTSLARAVEAEWHGRYQKGVEGALEQARAASLSTGMSTTCGLILQLLLG
jgi:hypothetical protein